ncbi:DNA polymerase III subunit beta [Bacteroidia bacterium]|nr:DNA polymerase III subunit beta [Bacteroidia bacterium]
MKFIVNSQVFSKKIRNLVGLTASGKSTSSILNYFLLELSGKKLSVTASDTETTVKVFLELQEKGEDGKVAVPAKILKDLLDNLGDIPVGISIDAENKIDITAGKGKYAFVGESAELFPIMEFADNAKKYEIKTDIILQGIQKTIFATSDEALRQIMMGVHFEFSEEGVNFIGTDAHKLVRLHRSDWKTSDATNFTVHKKALNLLKDILSDYANDEESQLEMQITDKNICFTLPDAIVYCRLVDGTFPAYRTILPKENNNVLIVETSLLKSSLKRMVNFAAKSTYQVYFKIQGQELSVIAEDVDYATKADDNIACEYDGEAMDISFNAKFVLEMLNVVESDKVKFALSIDKKPGLIFPMEQNESEDLLMLVMPMAIA